MYPSSIASSGSINKYILEDCPPIISETSGTVGGNQNIGTLRLDKDIGFTLDAITFMRATSAKTEAPPKAIHGASGTVYDHKPGYRCACFACPH